MSRRFVVILIVLTSLLGASPALSGQTSTQDAPVTTHEIPGDAHASDHPYRLGNVGRSVFFGLVGAGFLAFCALVTARDGKPRSRRP